MGDSCVGGNGRTDKPAVILLHGIGLDRTCWNAQASALAPHGDVIAYDLLGHGDCRKPEGKLSLHDYAEQLRELMDRRNLDKAVLVGFSFGGLVLQLFASTHGERVRKLVIMGTTYKRTPAQIAAVADRLETAEREGPEAIVEAALARWYGPEYRAAHPNAVEATRTRLKNNVPHEFLAAYRILATSDHLVAGRLGRIAAPTLVIAGELDPGSTPAMAETMAAEIPDARLCIVPGARHMLPVESAEAVNRALIDFIRE